MYFSPLAVSVAVLASSTLCHSSRIKHSEDDRAGRPPQGVRGGATLDATVSDHRMLMNMGGGKQANGDTITVTVGGIPNDFTTRTGLGESPGIPSLEYLGCGYDIVRGNPRGSERSELDPGFRSPVVELVQLQSDLTLDQDFLVPLGTEVKTSTSCAFESTSKEVATVSDYQNSLSIEASASGSGFGASFSASFGFNQFNQDRVETQTTTFETMATCTIFEAKLKPYYSFNVTESFRDALETLPVPFVDSPLNRSLFEKFIDTFGTDYVSQLTLGAKHIFSSIFESSEVLNLQRMGVNVGASVSARGFGVSGEASFQYNRSEMNLNMVSEKITTVNEVNIGGSPPEDGDWQTWAATVPARPMPILYTLNPVTDYMSAELAEAFNAAATLIFDSLDLVRDEEFTTGVVAKSMRFGVAMPTGGAVTPYSTNRRSTLRTSAVRIDPLSDPDFLNFFSYDIVFESIEGQVPSVFANLIRDNLSVNVEEDAELGVNMDFIDGAFYLKRDGVNLEFKPFGFSTDLNVGKVAIFSDGNVTTDRLLHFSYLSVVNLPENTQYVSGLVHPQGYPLNARFGVDPGYEVQQLSDNQFHIKFTDATTFSNNRPTILVFPQWLPFESTVMPMTSGQVSVATYGVSTNGFKVQAGSETVLIEFCETASDLITVKRVDEETDQFLGFSFLAIDEALDNPGLVHGHVTVDPNSGNITDQDGHGFFATSQLNDDENVMYGPDFDEPDEKFIVPTFKGGVLIEFDEEFLDIPSVVVTPLTQIAISDFRFDYCDGSIFQSLFSDLGFDDRLFITEPIATVEHISKTQALVKVGVLNTIQGFGTDGQLPNDFRALIVAAALAEGINLAPMLTNNGNDFRLWTPVSFSFVAVAPIKLDNTTTTTA